MQPLHDYQEAAVHHLQQRIAAGEHRLYITLPTGTGKSLILATIAANRLPHGRVLVLIHRQDIAHQLARVLRQAGLEAGLLMQGHREIDRPVLVALVSSLTDDMLRTYRQSSEMPVATILIDEAHHAVEGSAYERILTTCEANDQEQRIVAVGFTATPFRSDTRSMRSVLPTCAFVRDIPDMIKAGWLAPLTWMPVKVDIDLPVPDLMDSSEERDYAEEDLVRALMREAITRDIVQQVVPSLEQRPTLVFAVSVEHAAQCAELLTEQGVRAVAISGRTRLAERERVFAAWRCGDIQAVCNCTLLTEGFDFPAIAALVMARPTRSPGLYVQMLGRGMRLAPGKQDCLVFDVMSAHQAMRQQVVFPRIIGRSSEARVSHDRGANTGRASWGEDALTSLLGDGTETGLSLLDPIGQSELRWTQYHDAFFTMISREWAVIIERDPGSSGLYRSRWYGMLPGKAPVHQWIKQNGLPLQEQVAYVQEAVTSQYRAVLGAKDAPWLHDPVSEKQLAGLERFHPELARQAREQAWTKGDASQVIALNRLRPTLEKPPPWGQGTA